MPLHPQRLVGLRVVVGVGGDHRPRREAELVEPRARLGAEGVRTRRQVDDGVALVRPRLHHGVRRRHHRRRVRAVRTGS